MRGLPGLCPDGGGRRCHWAGAPGGVGYPMRGIGTADFLCIRNFKPETWPAGDPRALGRGDVSETYPYLGGRSAKPPFPKGRGSQCGHGSAVPLPPAACLWRGRGTPNGF